MVFIHEWGHFAAARFFKVKVETFAIGFGKSLWSRKDQQGTLWTVNLLPLGGYVKLFGDAGPASNQDLDKISNLSEEEKSQTFYHKKLWQKAIIVFAGPLMNYVLAIVVGFFLLSYYGEVILSTKISAVTEASPAAKAGLQQGDEIIALDGKPLDNLFELKKILSEKMEGPVTLTYKRNDQEKTVSVVLDKGKLGIMGQEERINYNLITSFEKAVIKVWQINQMIFEGIKLLLSGQGSKEDLGGPIKIAQITGMAFEAGLEVFLQLLILLSINLGLINLLPIPGLDGGHLLFYLIEGLSGRPLKPELQNIGIKIGFFIVIGLLIFVTINDLLFYVKK